MLLLSSGWWGRERWRHQHVCLFFCFRLIAYKLRIRVFFFSVCVLTEAGRDQCCVCRGQCGCCCTIKSHQFSPVNKLAWRQRYAHENVPGWGAEPGSLSQGGWRHPRSRSLCPSTQTLTHTLKPSLSHSVPSLLSLGFRSKCLALGTFTSPKLNHSPCCTFSHLTRQIP